MLVKSNNEKRSAFRYTFQDIAYTIVNTENTMVGHLIDISTGGLGFSYIGSNFLEGENTTIDIFLYYMNLYMQNIPVSVISNFPLTNPSPASRVAMMRCGIKFSEIPAEQQDKIQCIINSLMERCKV